MEILSVSLERGVVQVSGELDVATADELKAALIDALAENPRVLVDLEGLTFIDAAGMHAILEVARTMNGRGPLTLIHAGRLRRLLEIVGLTDVASLDVRENE